jgi:Spy/CpxP family protein refolding chaperone
MSKKPLPRPRLLAITVIALALVVGGLAGATLDRTLFRHTGHAAYPAEWGAWPVDPASHPHHSTLHGDPASDLSDFAAYPDRAPHRGRMRNPEGRRPGMSMRPQSGARYLDQLTHELELSAEQRDRIEVLLRRQQERMRTFRQEMRQQSGAIVTETRTGIFEILTPEQRATLQRTGRAPTRQTGT